MFIGSREGSTRRQPSPSDKAPDLCQRWGCDALQQHWEEGSGSSFSFSREQRSTSGCRGKIFGSFCLVVTGFVMFVVLCEGVRVRNVIWARILEIVNFTLLKLFNDFNYIAEICYLCCSTDR